MLKIVYLGIGDWGLGIGDCSHYMMEEYATGDGLKNEKAKALYNHIKNNYSTLAWSTV